MKSAAFLVLFALSLGCSGAVAGRADAPAAQTPAPANVEPSPVPTPAGERADDLSDVFKETVGCFVFYDSKRGRYVRHDAARARERFNPKSTFKIPNSLIGLDSGVIRDADFRIKWDKEKYPSDGADYEPFKSWWRDHTLRTAFRNSVVWYYRELATRVGPERMKSYVESFAYGDANTSGPVDQFWLNNTLKISADEQLEFLRRLEAGRLPVSRRALDTVREVMVLEETPRYALRAKTGGGEVAPGRVIGWYVGYVTTADNTYFFAANIEGPTYLSIRDRRIEITKQALRRLGALPAE
ncbi:MAG TPA: penicillin-binding transpeptidase domain-containing protein [Pyrinomonadaceae bacterium]|nr:penicillin-binding transpeptidase domain-containing protein [Pyrinomonadaceae bacterium]